MIRLKFVTQKRKGLYACASMRTKRLCMQTCLFITFSLGAHACMYVFIHKIDDASLFIDKRVETLSAHMYLANKSNKYSQHRHRFAAV